MSKATVISAKGVRVQIKVRNDAELALWLMTLSPWWPSKCAVQS